MKKLPVYLVTILLCVITIWMMLSRDRTYSENENRKLADFPEITKESLIDGSFMDGFETYLADQFPTRDFCVSVKNNALYLTGSRKAGSVYLAKNGFLIAEESPFENSLTKTNIKAMNALSDRLKDVKTWFMLVPNTIESLEELLPYGMQSDQEKVFDLCKEKLSKKINFVDVREVLSGEKTYYYKTDHHWTTRGAFAAYCFWKKGSAFNSENKETSGDLTEKLSGKSTAADAEHSYAETISEEGFVFYTVTDDFCGTQGSNSGKYDIKDSIEICEPKNAQGNYTVNYVEEGRKSSSLFDAEKLSGKDKYLVFQGGNYAEIVINTKVLNGRRLLIVKDSYANCFIPLLTSDYECIVVVDPRYSTEALATQIENYNINEMLYLYNVNSFVEDKVLQEVLK